jgi:hypothetical protein
LRRSLIVVITCLFVASCGAFAQDPNSSSQEAPPPPPAPEQRPVVQNSPYTVPALSRVSFGVGISPLGIGLQASTNLNTHLNVRATGNVFKYSTSFTTNGIPASANLNLASAGGLLDYYPFHTGFRLSGGILFVNRNQLSATASIGGGDSITLNGQTYYSANPNAATGAVPLNGTGNLSLNGMKPGALLTTGWGNHVKRSGHWSFPVEIGVAFVGTPKVTMNLGGWACTDATQTQCTDIGNPNNPIAMQFQDNLSAQITKWNHDLSSLSSYPVISVGVAYSFQVRRY